jgi:hypothetical protein
VEVSVAPLISMKKMLRYARPIVRMNASLQANHSKHGRTDAARRRLQASPTACRASTTPRLKRRLTSRARGAGGCGGPNAIVRYTDAVGGSRPSTPTT